MDPGTGRWLNALEDGRRLVLQEIRQLPPQARAWRPEPEAWSSIEVAHHLALAERLTVQSLDAGAKRQEPRRGLRAWLGRLAVAAVFRLGLRVRTPTDQVRPDPELGLHGVEMEWNEVRDSLLRYFRSVPPDRATTTAIVHPIAGPLDHHETLEFLASHQIHHLGQLRRLREERGFPWNA